MNFFSSCSRRGCLSLLESKRFPLNGNLWLFLRADRVLVRLEELPMVMRAYLLFKSSSQRYLRSSLEAAQFSGNRKNDIIARSREWTNMNVNGGLFPSIHFSPDTVLQDRGGFRLQRVETDNEPGRCRRTDGKKWRCSKDALSGQKYCDKHMHRGIKKKRPVETNSQENAGFSPLTVKTAARSVHNDSLRLWLMLM